MSKYGVFSGRYFPVFSPNTGKYGPEITPYLDIFHAVDSTASKKIQKCLRKIYKKCLMVYPYVLKKLLSITYRISCPLAKAPDFKWEDATTVDLNAWTYRRDTTLKDVRPIDHLIHLLIKTVR